VKEKQCKEKKKNQNKKTKKHYISQSQNRFKFCFSHLTSITTTQMQMKNEITRGWFNSLRFCIGRKRVWKPSPSLAPTLSLTLKKRRVSGSHCPSSHKIENWQVSFHTSSHKIDAFFIYAKSDYEIFIPTTKGWLWTSTQLVSSFTLVIPCPPTAIKYEVWVDLWKIGLYVVRKDIIWLWKVCTSYCEPKHT
jgi:hypothetical protein